MNGVDPLGLEGGLWGGVKKIGTGLGKLWDKAPAGIGEAASKGAKGAGAAPIVAAGAGEALPAMMGAAMQHPAKLAAGSQAAFDFANGYFDEGPPPPSLPGYVGGMLGKAKDIPKKR